MKSIQLLATTLFMAIAFLSQAQINYQAVVRDSDNQPSINQNIDIEVSISQDGTVIYSEQHNDVNTGELGIVNLGIGLGANSSSDFNEIDWSLDNYEVTMTVDQQLLPSTPIRSVPIAEYAKKANFEAPIHIAEMQDITLTNSGGGVILGDTLGMHISIDNNEIMVKNNEDHSPLYLQAEGGNLLVHSNSQHVRPFIVRGDGRVGIGTTNPAEPLHIVTDDVNQGLRIQTEGVSEYIQMHVAPGAGSAYGFLFLGGNTRLRGNGRTSEFDGKVEMSCLQINGGCDITEPFESSVETIEPGTVVVMTENGVQPSNQAYDNRVVGVVSGANGIQKGMSLRQTELFENGIDIAIAGRVYVKAIGEVQIGDQLVSSDTPGVAKSEKDIIKFIGKSIGKALSTPDENGYVLMLVNLQ